jgi:hypothetical protein
MVSIKKKINVAFQVIRDLGSGDKDIIKKFLARI